MLIKILLAIGASVLVAAVLLVMLLLHVYAVLPKFSRTHRAQPDPPAKEK